MSEKSDTFKLVNAVELAKEARVGMELTYFDVVALIEENANLTAHIAELEAFIERLIEAGRMMKQPETIEEFHQGRRDYDALVADWKGQK